MGIEQWPPLLCRPQAPGPSAGWGLMRQGWPTSLAAGWLSQLPIPQGLCHLSNNKGRLSAENSGFEHSSGTDQKEEIELDLAGLTDIPGCGTWVQ